MSLKSRGKLSRKPKLIIAGAAVAVAVATAIAVPLGFGGFSSSAVSAGAPATPGPYICNQPVLDSPWYYDGGASTFTSGEYPGLPTYGSAGTSFPSATSGVIIPAGDNTAAALGGSYDGHNTVYYFEPGAHDIQDVMYTGYDSAYAGGYTPGAGLAVIDGVDGATHSTGLGGNKLSLSTASSGSNVDDTWEYLTIENYTSSVNGSVMGNINGGGADNGDVYKYDTIGPNEYGYKSGSAPPNQGQSSGGGYAIDGGSYTVIEYDCLTQDAQGAFNIGGSIGAVVANDEISSDGLGEYPDTGGPGASPYSCGCSGGGKTNFTTNMDIVNNYVHDNYNVGIWMDFNNTGALISHNYIASNWSSGIEYEADYNAVISDNTLTGNGWASDGAWPAGTGGLDCFGGIPCTEGNGPVSGGGGSFPYAAIYLPNSGGNANLGTVSVPSGVTVPGCVSSCTVPSRYQGELLVQGNRLADNFGGVMAYTDTGRYPDNGNNDSACSTALGTLNQNNNATYYQQPNVLYTAADATITGSAVATTGGTTTICNNYGSSSGQNAQQSNVTQAPSSGMAVYDSNTGAYLGDIATVTSAFAFTLNDSPGNESGASLYISAYGGCGPADFSGGSLGVTSGTPAALYWDNCIWGSRNVTVSGNTFIMDGSAVADCTTGNLCGYMAAIAFTPGIPLLGRYWFTYTTYVAKSSGGLGNAWSDNAYTWSGGGPGSWQFQGGDQGTSLTQSQWTSSPYSQDAGSTF